MLEAGSPAVADSSRTCSCAPSQPKTKLALVQAHTTACTSVLLDLLDLGGEPLRGAHLQQGVHAVGVLADVGVDERQPDVGAGSEQDAFEPRVVVLGRVAGVEESNRLRLCCRLCHLRLPNLC